MKDMMGTFKKGFVAPQKADFYELPKETWGEEEGSPNLFIDIGKTIAWLHKDDLVKQGYIDLDQAWKGIDPQALMEILCQGFEDEQINAFEKRLKDLMKKYPSPYKGHKLYYGFTLIKHSNVKERGKTVSIIDFKESTDKSSKTQEKFKDNKIQVTFYILHYNHETLGYKPPKAKPAGLGTTEDEEKKEVIPYSMINFFLSPTQVVDYISAISDTQSEDQEARDVEFCYLISTEIAMSGKFLNGYIHDLWC